MRVLFLGEFSGLYKYIVEGLRENGIDVDWYANGDHWKKISGMTGTLEGNTGVKLYDKIIFPLLQMKKWKRYDIVQIVSPLIFSPKINVFLLKWIKRNNKKIILTSAGTDIELYRFYKAGKFKLPYYAFDGCDYLADWYEEGRPYAVNDEKVLGVVDYIIPTCYEYNEVYKNHPKYLKMIPMSVNVDTIKYEENVIQDKVVIFHGLNREVFKGTPYIREAMEKVGAKYPDEVEMVIDGKMPIDEYTKLLGRTNVVIDQCKGYSSGINSLLCMAMGKVVLGGNEDIAHIKGLTDSSPVINIRPDVEHIEAALEWIVNNKDKIVEIGRKSREYVENVHDYRKIANQYVEAWKQIL